jgi:hypothetical protein
MSDFLRILDKHRERALDMNTTLKELKGINYAQSIQRLIRITAMLEAFLAELETWGTKVPEHIHKQIISDLYALGCDAARIEVNNPAEMKEFFTNFEAQFTILLDVQKDLRGQ